MGSQANPGSGGVIEQLQRRHTDIGLKNYHFNSNEDLGI